MHDEPIETDVARRTEAMWTAPVRPHFRVLAGLLSVLSLLGGVGLAGAAWYDGWGWLLAVPVVIAFGIVMGQVAIRGRTSRLWIRGLLFSEGLADL